MGLLFGVLTGLGIGIIVGLSYKSEDRPVFRIGDALIVGLVGGLISGFITWTTGTLLHEGFRIGLLVWMNFWLPSWLSVGVIVGIVAGLIAKRKKGQPVEAVPGAEAGVRSWVAQRWRQWLIAGVIAALSWSLVLGLLMGLGQWRFIQALALASGRLGLTFFGMLIGSLYVALYGAAMGALSGALFGALLGALRGALTGPDIDRRTVPNQGIWQSAANVRIFALVGGLTLGAIWGLLNLSYAVLVTGVAPEALDWLSFGLSGMLFLGLLSAFVPGTACLQHFTLRFILWCRGVAPWHYARFLDYATERMLLQRVGGRYRFIHDLLRDHFAAMEPELRDRVHLSSEPAQE
jgi:hypothetical protein